MFSPVPHSSGDYSASFIDYFGGRVAGGLLWTDEISQSNPTTKTLGPSHTRSPAYGRLQGYQPSRNGEIER